MLQRFETPSLFSSYHLLNLFFLFRLNLEVPVYELGLQFLAIERQMVTNQNLLKILKNFLFIDNRIWYSFSEYTKVNSALYFEAVLFDFFSK